MRTLRNRKDFIDQLRSAERYQVALAAAKTDAERAQIAAFVEQFVGGFADVLAPLIAHAQDDPDFAKQLGRALVEQSDVLSASSPAMSGSAEPE